MFLFCAWSKYIHFLGFRNDLESIYSDLDIVALTSNNEGTPVALIEALANNLPIITTNVGGIGNIVGVGKKIIDKDDFLSFKKSPIKLKKRKIKLVNEANSYSEEVRRSIKENYGFKKLYAEGLSINVPLDINYQIYALKSLREGIESYDRRHGYRGPLSNKLTNNNWKEELAKTKLDPTLNWVFAEVTGVSKEQLIIKIIDSKKEGKIIADDIKWAIGKDIFKKFEIGDIIFVKRNKKKKNWELKQYPKVNGSIVAFDVEVYTFTFTIEVAHVAGWNAIASDADLEIDPSGSTVSLTVVQEGNSPTRPYVSVQVDGEIGWVVETPDELPILDPGGTATLDLQITPPSTARHGRTVELHVRLREGDGSSEATITLPLRVAVIHEFSLQGTGNWIVSDDGGYPHAELQNLGNAPTTISLEVLSLPQGWNVSGPNQVVIAVGEVTGVPLEVIPSPDWDGHFALEDTVVGEDFSETQFISIEYSHRNLHADPTKVECR